MRHLWLVPLAVVVGLLGAAGAGRQQGGSITGTVKFTGTPPANPKLDMSEEAACKGKYTTDPVVVVSNGALQNVLIYVKSGLPAGQKFSPPTTPAVVDQEGCLYHPRTVAVMVGQPLEIRNSDPVLHNIKVVPKKNRGFNISQPTKGMKTTRTFTVEEIVIPVQCNVHGWMHANLAVFSHPFFAVSGADGTFSIKGLPPGKYEIEAWHEKLGVQTLTVTVPAGGSAAANFTFSAKAGG
jgi:plastocyanin